MKHTTNSRYMQPITGQYKAIEPIHVDQEIMQRVTGLISLGFNLINILILFRFLLDLLNASLFNPFARLIFNLSEPFLSMFEGLIRSPLFRDVAPELTTLIAVTIYSLLGWSLAKLIRILFARQS